MVEIKLLVKVFRRMNFLVPSLFLAINGVFVNAIQINIDGGWSPWSLIETQCVDASNLDRIVLCGGGVRKRYRSCTNPTPQGSGAHCEGDKEDMFPCNTHPCQLPDDFLWSPWSPCSASCGRGRRKRHTMCGTIREKNGNFNRTGTISIGSIIYELEYETVCQSNQYREDYENCNTWNQLLCPSPCEEVKCPQFARCVDESNHSDPIYRCECQIGTIMKDDNSDCIQPPPVTPTPKPVPSLPPAQKTAATIMTRGASTLIIIFLSSTLGLFIILRIFDSSRVIHMNMEIALLLAHICLLPTLHSNPSTIAMCTIVSILTNFFFIACFMFMFLESLHVYSMVAWVVNQNGLFSRGQNIFIGWTMAFIVILFDMCFEYDHFGGDYHCFLRLNTPLMYGIYLPILVLTILTFAIVEAAGASNYNRLDSQDQKQRTTAKIMQRTLIFILPMVFSSYVLGTLAEYEQNLYFYSIFTLINGILGGMVFFFHCSANQKVREVLTKAWRKLCPKGA